MRTLPAWHRIPAAVTLSTIALASLVTACSGDDATTVTTLGSTTTAAATGAAPVVSSDLPLSTVPTPDSADLPIVPPINSTDLPIAINVTVGVDSATDRIETVPLGATIALTVTNPDADDEFHLHGFDLGEGVTMPAGQSETFTFSAITPGDFELESHSTDTVLLVLRVA